ncbi:MAG: phosphatidylglycerophosphatase A [Calditrichaeota bacterium]|nr:MAG: phosphatidylglycerophosphatase A [Calditrichota bacterium]
MKHLSLFVATGMYSGYLRPFSGTWGTIPAWLIAFYLIQGNILYLAITTVLVFILSVWSAGEAEKVYGHDSKNIVIDEWAGMFVTILFVPVTLKAYIIAFLLFRIFDVVKLYPAAQFENLPGGWGVTMDDVAAGVYANIATQLVLYGITYFNL